MSGPCRLCLKLLKCDHNLYDENGRRTNVYELLSKYFTPELLDMECANHLTHICVKCWLLINEFHTFQQCVLLNQRKLAALNPKVEFPTNFQQEILLRTTAVSPATGSQVAGWESGRGCDSNSTIAAATDQHCSNIPVEEFDFKESIIEDSKHSQTAEVPHYNNKPSGGRLGTSSPTGDRNNLEFVAGHEDGTVVKSEVYEEPQSIKFANQSDNAIPLVGSDSSIFASLSSTGISNVSQDQKCFVEFGLEEEFIAEMPSNPILPVQKINADETDSCNGNSIESNHINEACNDPVDKFSGGVFNNSRSQPEALKPFDNSSLTVDRHNVEFVSDPEDEVFVKSEVFEEPQLIEFVNQPDNIIPRGGSTLTSSTTSLDQNCVVFDTGEQFKAEIPSNRLATDQAIDADVNENPTGSFYEISNESIHIKEDYDEPVGTFIGGEFDNSRPGSAQSQSEDRLSQYESCGSDSYSSDDEIPLALSIKRQSNAEDQQKELSFIVDNSNSKAKDNDANKSKGNTADIPQQQQGRESNQADTNIRNNRISKYTPNESKKRTTHKRVLEFDESKAESAASNNAELDGDSQNKCNPRYRHRRKISYLKNVKRPKTTQEYDEFIAKWRPILQCVVCQETCSTFSLLHQHFADQHPTEDCYIWCCQVKFYHRYEIEKHIHYHNEPGALKCEICFKCYSTKDGLQYHLSNKHSANPTDRKFKCPQCSSSFIQRSNLARHLKQNCDKDRKKKDRKSIEYLKKHYKAKHTAEKCKVFKCSICDKVFRNHDHLRTHMDKHRGERNEVCPWCPQSYLYRTSLMAHFKRDHPNEFEDRRKEQEKERHKEKQTYECGICDNVYHSRKYLMEHQAAIHNGIAMYPCKHCPKEFKYKAHLRVHVRRLHSNCV